MTVEIKDAAIGDLDSIVGMLADDPLGRMREELSRPVAAVYVEAFAAIEADPNQRLVVAVREGQVIGCLQVTFIPGLSRRGMWRGQIEAVRVAASERGRGVGRAMFEWALLECRARGCGMVQLTTDKSREEARRFYEDLGFVASHEGMKCALD